MLAKRMTLILSTSFALLFDNTLLGSDDCPIIMCDTEQLTLPDLKIQGISSEKKALGHTVKIKAVREPGSSPQEELELDVSPKEAVTDQEGKLGDVRLTSKVPEHIRNAQKLVSAKVRVFYTDVDPVLRLSRSPLKVEAGN